MILININAAFVFSKGGGGSFVFMQPVAPLSFIFVLSLFCTKQKFSYFCIFFSCGKPDCIRFFFFFFPLYLCIGDKGGERAVIAVCVSSFHFIFLMRGIKGLGVLTPCF